MNFAQEKQGASRYTGIGIVALIHVVAIWGLASGLAKDIVKKVIEPIDVKVIEEQVKPPPPPEKVVPPPPDLKAPPPPFVPPPEFQVTAPAPPAPPIISTQVAPPVTEFKPAPAPTTAPAPPAARTGPVKVGVACSKTVVPEISVEVDSPVILKATATVRGGRLVDIKVQKISGGSPDRKALRSMQSSIEAAMSSYQCQGTDIQVEQEFQVNPP